MTQNVLLVDVPPSLMRSDLRRDLPAGPRFSDCTGDKYPDCTCIGFVGFLGPMATFLYECKCGNQFVARGPLVKHLGGQSCGCKRPATSDAASAVRNIHSMMLSRCFNKNVPCYDNYGGRGITVCQAWRESIETFARNMGPRPEGLSIDRRNNDGHYSCGKCVECKANGWPANCRWATHKEQARNTRWNRWFTLNGKTLLMTDWALELGITRERMRQRVDKCIADGINIAEALTTPAGETMPSLANGQWRRHLRITERNHKMVKDEWFDGRVHVIHQGKHWSAKIACETFRGILGAEAASRGGKCKSRILNDYLMFVFEKKQKRSAVA